MIRLHSLFLLLLLSTSATSAYATTLKIATIVPNGTTWMKELKSASGQIATETEGRVKLKFYPGGIMGNDQSVLRKIRIGQIHGGALSGGALNKIYNGAQIYSIPFLFRNHSEVELARKILDPAVSAALEKKGFVVLGISEGGFAHLFSNKAIHNTKDLQGQKIWVPEGDQISRHAFESVGISPVALPVSDVYTGLQTGLLDTVGINPTGAIALQWHTKVSHVVNRPLLFLMGFMVVNKKVFARLSDADQKIVHTAVAQAFSRLDEKNRSDDTKAMQALLSDGINSVEVTETDYQHWRNITRKALDTTSSQQIYPPDLLKKVEDSLSDFRTSKDS